MFLAGREEKRAQRMNDFYDELFGAVDVSPNLPSLEALLGWMKQHRDMQTTNLRFQVADVAVEAIEELRTVVK
jgi:hypothetical protein